MFKNQILLLILLSLLLAGVHCNTAAKPEEEEVLQSAQDTTLNQVSTLAPVKVMQIKRSNFAVRLLTNGVLKARQQARISLESGGLLQELPLEQGKNIAKGALMARVDTQELALRLKTGLLDLADALNNRDDKLIAQGGRAGEVNSIPAAKLKMVNLVSGYDKALHAVDMARFQLEKASLYAPFSGIVTQLKVKQYEQVSPGVEICTLINPSTFEAEFSLLENEALVISTGQTVKINPTALPGITLQAVISRIDPVVNDQGLVTIKAQINGLPRKDLLEGMHLRISIEKTVHHQLAVPKSALVLRSGREVVFVYDQEAKLAKWKYVRTAYENDKQFAIAEGLEEGDWVIFEGNLNLDHDAEVEIVAQNNAQ